MPDNWITMGELLEANSTANSQPVCSVKLARFVFRCAAAPRHKESEENRFQCARLHHIGVRIEPIVMLVRSSGLSSACTATARVPLVTDLSRLLSFQCSTVDPHSKINHC